MYLLSISVRRVCRWFWRATWGKLGKTRDPLTRASQTAKKVRPQRGETRAPRLYKRIQGEASVPIYILALALSRGVPLARVYSWYAINCEVGDGVIASYSKTFDRSRQMSIQKSVMQRQTSMCPILYKFHFKAISNMSFYTTHNRITNFCYTQYYNTDTRVVKTNYVFSFWMYYPGMLSVS